MFESPTLHITLVSGVDQDDVDALSRHVVATLGLPNAEVFALRYRVAQDGQSPLISRDCSNDVVGEALIATDHGCIGCAVRDDVQQQIQELMAVGAAGEVVVSLPIGTRAACVVDPTDLAPTWVEDQESAVVAISRVLTVHRVESLEDDVSTELDFGERGVAAGAYADRPFAVAVIDMLAESDVVILVADGDAIEGEYAFRVAALVEHLAPTAKHLCGIGELEQNFDAINHDPQRTVSAHETVRFPAISPAPMAGVESVCWREARPFHPRRLLAALRDVAALVIDLRGHGWLANRPHEVLSFRIAGGATSLAVADAWLAQAPSDIWDSVSPARRTHAALTWTDEFHDRAQCIAFTVVARDALDDPASEVQALFAAALMSDSELKDAVAALDDPLEPWLGAPWVQHPALPGGPTCDGVHGHDHKGQGQGAGDRVSPERDE